eukprot:gnl/TRDRNA2_/TRDRNA2_127695_c0_seq1.p1 gnl/TRDRNA2_/TRDRNA2_127695_c0~~gnl/TRDRNA2_/TRDRNA2_127695_c0_seq1.p1  ORF type:complete len:311 (-),score=34.61 gnl/TRDRNA2_/TRDRNA2_127695_c0_seq1:290-1222(-)
MLFTQFSVASFAIINVADTFSDSTESTPRRLGLTEYYMQFSVNWMKNGWPYERCQPKLGLGCEGGFKAWCCDTDWNCVDQARAWYECHPKYFGPNLSNVCCPDEYSSLPSVVDDEDEDEDASDASEDEDARTRTKTKPGPSLICRGDWASEHSLWTRWMHVGTLVARTDARMIVLHAQEFQKAIVSFPTEHAVKYATTFVESLCDASKAELSDLSIASRRIVEASLSTTFPESYLPVEEEISKMNAAHLQAHERGLPGNPRACRSGYFAHGRRTVLGNNKEESVPDLVTEIWLPPEQSLRSSQTDLVANP